MRVLAGGGGAVVVALVAFALVFVSQPSRTAFSVVGGMDAHDCPGSPAVAVIPPSDVVVVTGWKYQGRFGTWRAVTWDDGRGGAPSTRLVWVTEEDLRNTVGRPISVADEHLVTDPAFDTCTPPLAPEPTVLGTTVTRVPSRDVRAATVPGAETTAVVVSDPQLTSTTAHPTARAISPGPTRPAVTTGTTVSTTTSPTITATPKPATTTTSTSTTVASLKMPDVVGLAYQDAHDQLVSLELHVTALVVELPLGDSRDGMVVSQLPAAGTAVTAGTTTFIGVGHLPEVVVPDVVGQYDEDAIGILEDAGFEVDVVHAPHDSPDNVVDAQDPPGGSHAPAGSTVTLTVNSCC